MRPLLVPFLAIFAILTACSNTPAATTTTYVPPTTPGARACTIQCDSARDYCQQACDFNERLCLSKVQAQALQDYDKYSREQFAAHQETELLPRDFERDQSCDDTRKTCVADCGTRYQSCFITCGGHVEITTSCQFLCF